LIDDSVATLGTTTYSEATTKGLTIGALRRDADTSPVGTDNEIGPLTMDANGRLKVEIFDGGDSHTIDGTVTVGTFPDNEPFNVAQINAVVPLMGNGATGTGSLRVTVASDNSPVTGMGVGATGSAVPANANYIAGRATGNLAGFIICDNVARYNAATSGSTELVALTASQVIYICGYTMTTNSATGVDAKLVYGTGTNCATSPVDITGTWGLDTDFMPGLTVQPGIAASNALKTAASNALCINASAAVTVRAEIFWTKF